jgi:hypothetical protein
MGRAERVAFSVVVGAMLAATILMWLATSKNPWGGSVLEEGRKQKSGGTSFCVLDVCDCGPRQADCDCSDVDCDCMDVCDGLSGCDCRSAGSTASAGRTSPPENGSRASSFALLTMPALLMLCLRRRHAGDGAAREDGSHDPAGSS